jgi:hypothetical protein
MKTIPKSVIRNFLLLVVVATVVGVTHLNSAPAVAKPKEQANKYLEHRKNISSMVLDYHETLNKLFNERIKALNEEKDIEKLLKLVVPPVRNKKGVRECVGEDGKPNLSTFCLAESGMLQFFQLRAALEETRELLQTDAANKFERINAEAQKDIDAIEEREPLIEATAFGPNHYFKAAILNDVGIALQRVEVEIDVAEKTLDQSLAAYNEFQMALPLHRKNQEIIRALEDYRDQVAKVRDEITVFPDKFTNVSTTQCQ